MADFNKRIFGSDIDPNIKNKLIARQALADSAIPNESIQFTKVDGKNVDISKDDDYSLGVHLSHDHNLKCRSDFNKNYKVFIIDNCSPKFLEYKEHKFIHLLKTLRPLGINTMNPFCLNLLH